MKTKLFLLVPAMLLTCSGILCLRPLAPVEVTTAPPGQNVSTAIPSLVSPLDLRHSPPGPEIGRRAAAQIVPTVAPMPAPAKDTALKLTPSAEQLSLWKALSEARLAVDPLTEREKALPQNQGVEYFARNPSQQITARFLADGGVRLGSCLPGRSWQATLRLGTGITASAVTATTNRVEACHRGGLTEWFENRPEGIEHGFTVVGPQGDTGRLEISLALDDLRAEADFDAIDNLRFVGEDGTAILGYGGLKAWDATGKALPAEMRATGDGCGMLLAVDARGASYPVRIDPLIVSLEQKLIVGDGAALDWFGRSLALAGDTAVVGAIGEDTAAGDQVGCAYVFVRSGTVWTQQAKLTASDGTAGARLGYAVALAGDTALIGTQNGGWGPDSAYVFTRAGTVWTQQSKLVANDGAGDARFGESVALSGDTALIGAFYDDMATGGNAGSAYVFTRAGTVWTQQAKLRAGDAAPGDIFGYSVALAGDTALVGAKWDDTNAGNYAGSAYVFTRTDTVWTQRAKLAASDWAAYDYFGCSVALADDTALVGAYADWFHAGSAYVFTRAGTVWTQVAKLMAKDGADPDCFGNPVALAGDTALIVGESISDGSSAFVFTRVGTVWAQRAKLTAGFGAVKDGFGVSVALAGDTALVGAVTSPTAAGAEVGSAYVFRLRDDAAVPTYAAWAAAAGLTGSDAEPSATPFDDGVENLLKYAFSMNGGGPDVRVLVAGAGTAGLPRITLDRGGPILRFEYLRRKGSGIGYVPFKSTTLVNWLPLTGTPTVTDIDAAWERVVIAEPSNLATAPRLFGRVKVVLPP